MSSCFSRIKLGVLDRVTRHWSPKASVFLLSQPIDIILKRRSIGIKECAAFVTMSSLYPQLSKESPRSFFTFEAGSGVNERLLPLARVCKFS